MFQLSRQRSVSDLVSFDALQNNKETDEKQSDNNNINNNAPLIIRPRSTFYSEWCMEFLDRIFLVFTNLGEDGDSHV